MSLVSFVLILACVLLNAAAQVLLKAGTNAAPLGWRLAVEPHVVSGLILYGVSVVPWIAALSRVPVSIAYPVLISLGYVANALAAWQLLGETPTPMRVAGTGVILLGVLMVARS